MRTREEKASKKTKSFLTVMLACVLVLTMMVVLVQASEYELEDIKTEITEVSSETLENAIDHDTKAEVASKETAYEASEKATEETTCEAMEVVGENTTLNQEELEDAAKAQEPGWDGPVLSALAGVVQGPSGRESYYNMDMTVVIELLRREGYQEEYWVREDGCKMFGDYIMCAANYGVHPFGSLVESSLGTCIVCDTGGFAEADPTQLDIATNW